jgi:hypothetical protein
MLIGMYHNQIPVDLILFADTGAERPETYEYIQLFERWLLKHGFPSITHVKYTDENGNRLTLEDECIKSKTLPSLAYGFKKCSLKHKRGTQDKFCNRYPECKNIWRCRGKCVKRIGYDADEPQRKANAIVTDIQDKKYDYRYPLIDDWGWGRKECQEVIQSVGLPLPGKSSCFFCPSMKKREIRELHNLHPNLFERALAIERNAADGLISVKGLGRDFAWADFEQRDKAQSAMCGAFEDSSMPCGCYDG